MASKLVKGLANSIHALIYAKPNRKAFTKRLARCNPAKTIILANTASFRNLGDHAITLGELAFLKYYFPSYDVLEIFSEEWRQMHGIDLSDLLGKSPAILLHGGGYLGTLWSGGEERTAMDIISHAGAIPCAYFPQTMYYSSDTTGAKTLLERQSFYKAHNNVSFILRDKNSYTFAAEHFPQERMLFAPDAALFLEDPTKDLPRKGVTICLRNDEECVLEMDMRQHISAILNELTVPYHFTDTVAPDFFPLEERSEKVNEKLQEFKSSELVITDRLHALIFCAITHTPCIALNNINGKVEGSYYWLQSFPFLHIAQSDSIGLDIIQSTLEEVVPNTCPSTLELLLTHYNETANFFASVTNLELNHE